MSIQPKTAALVLHDSTGPLITIENPSAKNMFWITIPEFYLNLVCYAKSLEVYNVN